jgi:ketosteroid isomerase-like protein
MSANLDLVRSISADWERGDLSRADWADPAIEVIYADGPSPGTYTGTAGMAEGIRQVASAWEEFSVVPDEFRQLDDERVLVLVHLSARGKTSGLEVGQMRTQGANVFHVRDGKVTNYIVYYDRDRALADLGLGGKRCRRSPRRPTWLRSCDDGSRP